MREGLWPDDLYEDWLRFYSPNKNNRKDPMISPLYISKHVAKFFPSTYIVSCEYDRIQSDAIRFSQILKDAKVDVRYYATKERHGFIERHMKDIYRLPNEPSVRFAKSIVDQEIVFALTTK